ncbi:MAG: peptidylprolyl isomerase [Candidatus Bathyarchaeota archaeon]|nr:peptidylprolyl isomerase [Candidatus Bathyarchaeota archaeon]
MPFKKGDFILIDYVASVSETGEIFDTTVEEVARKEALYKEGALYEPSLVAVGEGWVLKALDESLPNLKLKKTEKIEIPPEKAFGNRDPEKIKLYPLRKLASQNVTPQVGMRLEVDGRLATVRTIGSGRVLLDFNPPLAGKTLVYEVTVQKKLRTSKAKITALIHRRMPQVEVDKFSLEIGKDQVTVAIPEEAFYVEGLQIAKRGIFIDVQKFFPKIKTVTFTETFKGPEPVEEAPSSEETPESTEGSQ